MDSIVLYSFSLIRVIRGWKSCFRIAESSRADVMTRKGRNPDSFRD
jgi:hypothetical protein